MDRPATESTATRSRTARVWMLRAGLTGSLAILLALASACSGDDNPQGLPPGGTTTGTGSVGPCTDGSVRDCTIEIGAPNGVVTCVTGTELCADGVWQQCVGDAEPRTRPMSLSSPTACTGNPCDPNCKVFDEVPPGGIPTESQVVATYRNPEDKSIPGGFIGKGHNEPCSSNQDCQFDTKCVGPTSGTCAHHKCDTGNILSIGCDDPAYQVSQDSCVDEICNADPSCCGGSPGPLGTCSHHPCDEGVAEVDGCDPCITATCAAIPSCCQLAYDPGGCAHSPCDTGAALIDACDSADSDCVDSICNTHPECCEPTFAAGLAHDGCTLGVALDTGIDTCVDAVCNTNPGCCTPVAFGGACDHDPCITGKGLDRLCDPTGCVTAVCNVDADCCDGNGNPWDAACVALVQSECAVFGLSCSSTWDQSCADQVALEGACNGMSCSAAWDATCAGEVVSQCGENCTSGAWDAACVAQAETSCGLNCSAGSSWDQDCVDMVSSVCGAECNGTSDGNCEPFAAGEQLSTAMCAGVELTLGPPCTDSIPICNRGNTGVPAGSAVTIHFYPANSSHFPLCSPPLGGAVADCVTNAAIPAGYCVDVTESDCTIWSGGGAVLSGNRTAFLNPAIAGQVPECFCENNWSDYHSGDCTTIDIVEFGPTPYTDTYVSDCPVGSFVQWGYLTWDTTTPGDSWVDFSVATSDSGLGESSPNFPSIGTAVAAPTDTQACTMTGPAGCPIDLYNVLDLPYANYDTLELTMMLYPTTDLSAGPTVNDWEVTYSCVDGE